MGWKTIELEHYKHRNNWRSKPILYRPFHQLPNETKFHLPRLQLRLDLDSTLIYQWLFMSSIEPDRVLYDKDKDVYIYDHLKLRNQIELELNPTRLLSEYHAYGLILLNSSLEEIDKRIYFDNIELGYFSTRYVRMKIKVKNKATREDKMIETYAVQAFIKATMSNGRIGLLPLLTDKEWQDYEITSDHPVELTPLNYTELHFYYDPNKPLNEYHIIKTKT